MKRHGSDLDPELEAFLQPRKIQRQVPPELRAWALARGRAILAGDVLPPSRSPEAPPIRLARDHRLFRIALAASFAVVAAAVGAAVGAVAARHGRSAHTSQAASPDRAPPAPVMGAGSPSSEPPATATEREAARAPHPARPGAKGGLAPDLFTAELELVQRAHGAYTRHAYSVALTLVAEHARRFPKGPLAEQREALRVRSLAGAGRADEAHRAAAAFAVRFPRSVLLPRVAGDAESTKP